MRFEVLKGKYMFEGKEYEYEFPTWLSKAHKAIVVESIVDLLLPDIPVVTEPMEDKELEQGDKSDIAYIMETIQKVAKPVVYKKRYNYVLKDLIFDFVLSTVVGGVKILTSEEKEIADNFMDKFTEIEYFLRVTEVAENIKNEMNIEDLADIWQGVEYNVEYITGIKSNGLESSLTNFVNSLTLKVQQMDVKSMNEVANIFSNVKPEDITFEKLIEAYSNSDLMKREVAKDEEALARQREMMEETVKNLSGDKEGIKH